MKKRIIEADIDRTMKVSLDDESEDEIVNSTES